MRVEDRGESVKKNEEGCREAPPGGETVGHPTTKNERREDVAGSHNAGDEDREKRVLETQKPRPGVRLPRGKKIRETGTSANNTHQPASGGGRHTTLTKGEPLLSPWKSRSDDGTPAGGRPLGGASVHKKRKKCSNDWGFFGSGTT